MFDINKFKGIKKTNLRYQQQLERIRMKGHETDAIEKAVIDSSDNLKKNINSFVIYGEPQSGKTEMMICLTAKLLDEGRKVIVILLNDNVELLKQNLRRFQHSGIDPTPKVFTEVIDDTVVIGRNEWVIFCKKNAKDLRKLIEKLRGVEHKTVIDDEADYASPNSKISRNEISIINGLVGNLLGTDGVYIGVTATPARLDLNNTFDNANDKWVNFPTHKNYVGQDIFFPIKSNEKLNYRLELLSDQGDHPKYLKNALFDFFVTVAYLNAKENKEEQNYCMLVHTSGMRADHTEDYKNMVRIISILKNDRDTKYESYVKTIWEIAQKRFDNDIADQIVNYILRNISRESIVVMNCNSDKKNVDYSAATTPNVPFTIAIGGNIVSRGVTFENLLSMFFTRDVKHKIQQDTYIQRARMFGSRLPYLKYFELSIPERLFKDWHKCFIFHRLALESAKSGHGIPVWLEDKRVSAVSSSSIDKTTVSVNNGEMGFDIFDLNQNIQEIANNAYENKILGVNALKSLNQALGDSKMPQYVIDYVEHFMPNDEHSIAFHPSFSIANYSDANQEKIERTKGFIGDSQLEGKKFPHALHHFKIFYNKDNKARIFYKYNGNVTFLKNMRGN